MKKFFGFFLVSLICATSTFADPYPIPASKTLARVTEAINIGGEGVRAIPPCSGSAVNLAGNSTTLLVGGGIIALNEALSGVASSAKDGKLEFKFPETKQGWASYLRDVKLGNLACAQVVSDALEMTKNPTVIFNPGINALENGDASAIAAKVSAAQ